MTASLGKVQKETLNALNREIASGHFNVGDSLGNIRSLAARFNVSRTTITNVIRHLETLGLVDTTAVGNGVILKKKSPAMFDAGDDKPGLLFIRLNSNALGSDTFHGLINAPEANDFNVSLADADENRHTFLDILRHIPPNIKSIILFPTDDVEVITEINRLLERGVSVIQIDRINSAINSPGITFDNFSGGLQATLHLIREHNLPVYYLGDAMKPESMYKRYKGWEAAMTESGYLPQDTYRVPGFDDNVPCELQEVHNFYTAALERFLSKRKEQQTAIFAANDYIAMATYQVAEKLSIPIGKRLFLVGFDDLELCRRLSPPLSSVRVPRHKLGQAAVEMAATISEGNCVWRKILPIELIVRQSSMAEAHELTCINS